MRKETQVNLTPVTDPLHFSSLVSHSWVRRVKVSLVIFLLSSHISVLLFLAPFLSHLSNCQLIKCIPATSTCIILPSLFIMYKTMRHILNDNHTVFFLSSERRQFNPWILNYTASVKILERKNLLTKSRK